jgi:hypothetical protein
MSFPGSAPFTQESPSLTVSPPAGGLPANVTIPTLPNGGVVTVEGIWSTYTIVYTNKALGAALGTDSGFVDEQGRVNIALTSGNVVLITLAGVVTTDSTHTSGGTPAIQADESVNAGYVYRIADQQKGFNAWKQGVFLGAFLSTLTTAPTRISSSPSGHYVLLVDTTDNSVELWVGS